MRIAGHTYRRFHFSPHLRFSQRNFGFSYIGVLLAVAIAGIAMMGANRYWSTFMQREREAELLYRGNRIREAIRSYYENPPAGQRKQYPFRAEDLLRDPRFPQTHRHLRRWYPDPMAAGLDWALIRNASGRIKGAHSTHPGQPLKRGGFPAPYQSFETATSYKDWKFIYTPQK